VLVVGLMLAIPALTACATPGTGTAGSAADPSSAVPPAVTGSTGPGASSTEENPGDVTDPKPPGTEKTLRGTVVAGVEANCVLLSADDGRSYLLLGGDRALIMGGGRIEVTGLVQPDLMTTCQQGVPFTVGTTRKI
jgi:hypothetical protein